MENGNRFPKAETPVTQKKIELPKRQANGKANVEANSRAPHTSAQAAPPIRKGIYGHMGTGAGSLFLAGGEISNLNPPGKGQRKAPTVSYLQNASRRQQVKSKFRYPSFLLNDRNYL